MESDSELFVRYFLGGYFTFIAVFYSFRLILNRSDNTLTHLGRVGTSHWIGHITFRFFRLLIWWICVARIFYPEIDHYLGLFPLLKFIWLNLAGVALILSGFAIILICHRALGQNWRLGIDPTGPDYLLTRHIYSYSRNPIFIGVLIGQFGFFLALPGIFSLVCLIIGGLSIANQIKLEEAYLSERFGEQYHDYCQKVSRWF